MRVWLLGSVLAAAEPAPLVVVTEARLTDGCSTPVDYCVAVVCKLSNANRFDANVVVRYNLANQRGDVAFTADQAGVVLAGETREAWKAFPGARLLDTYSGSCQVIAAERRAN